MASPQPACKDNRQPMRWTEVVDRKVARAVSGDTFSPLCRPFVDRDGRIRTGDPLLPKQVRYQAAPRPDEPSLVAATTAAAGPRPRRRDGLAQQWLRWPRHRSDSD
jgi:hypothetical protein